MTIRKRYFWGHITSKYDIIFCMSLKTREVEKDRGQLTWQVWSKRSGETSYKKNKKCRKGGTGIAGKKETEKKLWRTIITHVLNTKRVKVEKFSLYFFLGFKSCFNPPFTLKKTSICLDSYCLYGKSERQALQTHARDECPRKIKGHKNIFRLIRDQTIQLSASRFELRVYKKGWSDPADRKNFSSPAGDG